MATHPSILAWEIPWTEEPGRLQSMESQSQTRLSDLACTHARRWRGERVPRYWGSSSEEEIFE